MQPQLLFSPLANQVRKVLALIVLVLAASTPTWTLASEAPQTQLPRTRIQAGMHFIDAQVAQSPAEMEVGLMHRKSMPANEGMLFVFPDRQPRCFWMKNTLLPLTAAFVADDGTIVNLADMAPQTTQSHCSAKPVRFVLEMHQGWFTKKNMGELKRN